MIWVGPVVSNSSSPVSLAGPRRHGVGVGISFDLAKSCQFRFDLVMLLVLSSFLSRFKFTFDVDMACPTIVSRSTKAMQYVEDGCIEGVMRLFNNRQARPTDSTMHGITLLHVAARKAHLDLVKLLIREGSDVNARDDDGETPLHWALASKDHYNVARVLIESGADISNRTIDGRTPLHTIFNNTVEQVLSSDKVHDDIYPDAQGMSLSHYVSWSSRTPKESFEKSLIHNAADLWSVDSLGRTCLHLTASRGNLELLTYLLSLADGIDLLNAVDNHGCTVLHYAVRSRQVGVLELLLNSVDIRIVQLAT